MTTDTKHECKQITTSMENLLSSLTDDKRLVTWQWISKDGNYAIKHKSTGYTIKYLVVPREFNSKDYDILLLEDYETFMPKDFLKVLKDCILLLVKALTQQGSKNKEIVKRKVSEDALNACFLQEGVAKIKNFKVKRPSLRPFY